MLQVLLREGDKRARGEAECYERTERGREGDKGMLQEGTGGIRRSKRSKRSRGMRGGRAAGGSATRSKVGGRTNGIEQY